MPEWLPAKDSRWRDKLSRPLFFVGALLFHLIIFLMVATWVIFQAPPPQPEPPKGFVVPVAVNPPAPPRTTPSTPVVDLGSSSITSPVTPPVPHGQPMNIHVGPAHTDSALGDSSKLPPKVPRISNPLEPRLHAIDEMYRRYRQDDPLETGDDVKSVRAIFPVYVASYANGDWDCNSVLDKDGNIVAGSMPDLVAKINEWSHGKIKGEVVPKPLNIGGPELLDKMPPFIFFTGHKDFVLTDTEIQNLRDYLQNGGAIWGDNAMAGNGSRFDVAFHREMKRVVPDKDKNFEPCSLTDDIFARSYYPISEIPPGINYYAELPQHLDIDNRLAIIYTPNDYSDVMFMRVLPGDKEVYVPAILPPNTLFTNYSFWYQRNVFYRNFNLASSLAVHRLGMNIVAFLLVRFDNDLLLSH